MSRKRLEFLFQHPVPTTPFLRKILSCLFQSQMEVCKKAIRVLGEGLLTPFEFIGLNMVGQ
jgi:hypothetical protein